MSRIKKRGLDYFPVDIGFMNDRLVRRIMKREGEGALATLMCAFSCIYGGEGYYVHADDLFYDELSANLYNQSAADQHQTPQVQRYRRAIPYQQRKKGRAKGSDSRKDRRRNQGRARSCYN